MKNLRQVFLGIIIALASIGLLLGGFSLSLAEGNSSHCHFHCTPTAYSYPDADFFPHLAAIHTFGLHLPLARIQPTPSPTWTPTLTLTPPPPPANCPPPAGWLVYFVQPGETLDILQHAIGSAVPNFKAPTVC